MEDITIIIPTKDREEKLSRKIEQINTKTDFRLLIANGTGNNTPFIKRIHEQTKKTDSKYIMLMSDDDVYYIDGIKKCVRFLEKNKDYSSAQGRWESFNGEYPCYITQRTLDQKLDTRFISMQNNYFIMLYSVFRADVFKEVIKKSLEFCNIYPEKYQGILLEYMFAYIGLIRGKHKSINRLYCSKVYGENLNFFGKMHKLAEKGYYKFRYSDYSFNKHEYNKIL